MNLEIIISAVVAILGVIATVFVKGGNAKKREIENETLRDTQDRLEKGRDAIRDGRDKSPVDRLRDNDGKW